MRIAWGGSAEQIFARWGRGPAEQTDGGGLDAACDAEDARTTRQWKRSARRIAAAFVRSRVCGRTLFGLACGLIAERFGVGPASLILTADGQARG